MSLNIEPPAATSGQAAAGTPAPAVPTPPAQTEHVDRSQAGVERRERVVTDAAGGVEHSEHIVHDVARERVLKIAKACQIVWLCVGVVEVLIGLRVVLKLIGANSANAFASFAYSLASLFLAPFFGLTGSPAAGGSILEVPSVIGMLVYVLLGWGIVKVVRLLFDKPLTGSSSTYDRSRL